MQQFYSNGKLLLTGEYLILEGAKGLALPTKFGQNLQVEELNQPILEWESIDNHNMLWYKNKFILPDLQIDNHSEFTIRLQNILVEAQKLNPNFLNSPSGFTIKTYLTFSRNWGLGSSSTLINNIAKWANINAFDLLQNTFGGSGYDIACANSDKAIFFQLEKNRPIINEVDYNPVYKKQLYFVYLNKKQNSQNSVLQFKKNNKVNSSLLEKISFLSDQFYLCKDITDLEKIILEHEKIIGTILNQKPIQHTLFSDYFGQTKSLGAWGGDFILATGNEETPSYFKNKGFETVIPYGEMILNK